MRMPRVRFTVRGMMVAVAIVSLMLWLAITIPRLSRWSREAKRRAVSYAITEKFHRQKVKKFEDGRDQMRDYCESRIRAERRRERDAAEVYHSTSEATLREARRTIAR